MSPLLLLGLLALQTDPAPITPDDAPHWQAVVLPQGEELAFEAIPWIPDFAEGLRAASREGKPLLFWAMNGHPLGCT